MILCILTRKVKFRSLLKEWRPFLLHAKDTQSSKFARLFEVANYSIILWKLIFKKTFTLEYLLITTRWLNMMKYGKSMPIFLFSMR
jgi:hypothetical protein